MTTSYYMQTKQAVLPRLEYYKDDLLKHDRASLRGYTGGFIHGSRDSGTDLILFGKLKTVKGLEWAVTFTLRSSNDLFLYGYDGRVRTITRDRAINLVTALAKHLARLQAKRESPDSIDTAGQIYKHLLPDFLATIPAH